jgi:hypothetical protein
MNTNAFIAAAHFFSLAETAAANGGFWVSAAGGTANVVAGVISRATGVSYKDAHHALDVMGREVFGDCWYQQLADIQPFRWDDWHDDVPGRWDARTIARAACRRVAA